METRDEYVDYCITERNMRIIMEDNQRCQIAKANLANKIKQLEEELLLVRDQPMIRAGWAYSEPFYNAPKMDDDGNSNVAIPYFTVL